MLYYYLARYNPMYNCMDVAGNNYMLRIYCNQVEEGLIMTPNSEREINMLALDYPWDYVRMALDGEFQAWIDAIDSMDVL